MSSRSHTDIQFLQIPDYKNSVIVARIPSQTHKASAFAEKLRIGMAVIHNKAADEEVSATNENHVHIECLAINSILESIADTVFVCYR